MYKDQESDELMCANFNGRYQNVKFLERTFEEVGGTEKDDNSDYDEYFSLDENDKDQ